MSPSVNELIQKLITFEEVYLILFCLFVTVNTNTATVEAGVKDLASGVITMNTNGFIEVAHGREFHHILGRKVGSGGKFII